MKNAVGDTGFLVFSSQIHVGELHQGEHTGATAVPVPFLPLRLLRHQYKGQPYKQGKTKTEKQTAIASRYPWGTDSRISRESHIQRW